MEVQEADSTQITSGVLIGIWIYFIGSKSYGVFVEVLGWLASDREGGDWENIIFGRLRVNEISL